jgi:hypothetical protein
MPVSRALKVLPVIRLRVRFRVSPAARWMDSERIFMPNRKSPRAPTSSMATIRNFMQQPSMGAAGRAGNGSCRPGLPSLNRVKCINYFYAPIDFFIAVFLYLIGRAKKKGSRVVPDDQAGKAQPVTKRNPRYLRYQCLIRNRTPGKVHQEGFHEARIFCGTVAALFIALSIALFSPVQSVAAPLSSFLPACCPGGAPAGNGSQGYFHWQVGSSHHHACALSFGSLA